MPELSNTDLATAIDSASCADAAEINESQTGVFLLGVIGDGGNGLSTEEKADVVATLDVLLWEDATIVNTKITTSWQVTSGTLGEDPGT